MKAISGSSAPSGCAWKSALQFRAQLAEFRLKFGQSFALLRTARFPILQFGDESFEGREGHAIGVEGGEVFVVAAEAERRAEVLRHGSDIALARCSLVFPAGDREDV